MLHKLPILIRLPIIPRDLLILGDRPDIDIPLGPRDHLARLIVREFDKLRVRVRRADREHAGGAGGPARGRRVQRVGAVDEDVVVAERETEDLEDAGEVAGETRGDGEGHFWLVGRNGGVGLVVDGSFLLGA